MANPAHLEALYSGSWNLFRKKYPNVTPDFVGANLQDANLENLDLKNANFQGANLRGVSFKGSVIQEANFQG
ncbi:MAG: pentapeptide repeat-containing protein, partial [Thermoanaerobaculia bacterium]